MKYQSGQRGILMIAAAMITIGIIVMVPTARVFMIQRTSESVVHKDFYLMSDAELADRIEVLENRMIEVLLGYEFENPDRMSEMTEVQDELRHLYWAIDERIWP